MMAKIAGGDANRGWARIDVHNDQLAVIAGPTEGSELVHMIIHCTLTLPNYGLDLSPILNQLLLCSPQTKRLFIQLSFGAQSTSAAHAVEFGCWLSSFVKSALAMHFSEPCDTFIGVTDGNTPTLNVAEHMVALAQDMRTFDDDPAFIIMLRRGCAINVGKTC